MNIIVPMAGQGKRFRPHTHSTPKPLFPIAGKPIVQRIVEDIAGIYQGNIQEIAFVTGRFGSEVEDKLLSVAASLGAVGRIFYQDEALGTAHAIWCARECLSGETIIAFADTLFRADFAMDKSKDGVIWVHPVEDPRSFGVVTLDDSGNIAQFVEKPEVFVSDLAIIGIYYVKNGQDLHKEIQYLLDNNVLNKGEYQLTDALENLKSKGHKFGPGIVTAWMDCGNKDAVLSTNQKILSDNPKAATTAKNTTLNNALIVEPCFIGDNVTIQNSVVGPFVSVETGAIIQNGVVKNSIIREKSHVNGLFLENSILGQFTNAQKLPRCLNLGDHTTL